LIDDFLPGLTENMKSSASKLAKWAKEKAAGVIAVGNKETSSDTMRNSKTDKDSKFMELKSSIIDELKIVRILLLDTGKGLSGAGYKEEKEIITKEVAVRKHLQRMQEEWHKMDTLYRSMDKKKKSETLSCEQEAQLAILISLKSEIDKVTQDQQQNYALRAKFPVADFVSPLHLKKHAVLGAEDDKSATETKGIAAGRQQDLRSVKREDTSVNVNTKQATLIEELKIRDSVIDQQLDEIELLIQDLSNLANMQGDEVKRQNSMLTNSCLIVDSGHNHVKMVNAKMNRLCR
jgi:hypothetical protein